MILAKAIFLDRKNRNDAIKEAKQAAQDINKKKVTIKFLDIRINEKKKRELNFLHICLSTFVITL